MIIRPPVFFKEPKGSNASHNAFGIWIRKTRITHPLAVLLQEFVEWRYLAWFRLMAFGLVGVGLTLILGQSDAVSVVLTWWAAFMAAVAINIVLPPQVRREMEFRGKMSEVVAAVELYNADFETKLRSEAKSLEHWYDFFDGVSFEEIVQELREEEPFARKQFEKHRDFILTFADKWGEDR